MADARVTIEAVSRLESFLREEGQKPGFHGLTAQQIGPALDWNDRYLAATLHASPQACREFRDGRRWWYIRENCPYEVNLLGQEILDRVRAARQMPLFVERLRKYMDVRAPKDWPDDHLLAMATEEDYRKCYGMIGPLPTVADLEAAREANEKQREQSDPEGPEEEGAGPWHFKISRRKARRQLADGSKRVASGDESLQWVANNLDNPWAQPADAPCNYAWTELELAISKPTYKKVVLDRIERMNIRMAKEKVQRQKYEDDFRRFFKLCDAWEAAALAQQPAPAEAVV